ncbi:hypothetical protein FRX31_032546 [Thalictrum thalictroides]|uniref:Uncharacterized protein n=1 Tax=Thalictrum thalictroides TaxID=46969 RepID=A0A7J6UZ04_THATH|nr:hypothetical protein FRX31_032546 [Thalictrum thalictroides]
MQRRLILIPFVPVSYHIQVRDHSRISLFMNSALVLRAPPAAQLLADIINLEFLTIQTITINIIA